MRESRPNGGDCVSLVGSVFTLTPTLSLRERGPLIGIHTCLHTITYLC